MREYHYKRTGKEVPHTCRTCESNFNGRCAGANQEANTPYKYGDLIDKSKMDIPCDSWDISFDEFCKARESYQD